LLVSSLAIIKILLGAEVDFHGQASSWLSAAYDTCMVGQAGLRYIPTLSFSLPFHLDAEASVNGYASELVREGSFEESDFAATVKPYRLWLRYSTARFETRAGLQKINFGSATLLRPLQWFDRVDPRDPLGLTDGVYGLLARYYFQNNANVWAWGLLGNSSPKGWEQVGSERWIPEFGGRAQLPIPRGELAATYHHRVIGPSGIAHIPELLPRQDEDRLGLDAKVDAGIGLCFEARWRARRSECPTVMSLRSGHVRQSSARTMQSALVPASARRLSICSRAARMSHSVAARMRSSRP